MARYLLPEVQGAITWAEWPGGKPGEEEVLGGHFGEGCCGHDTGRMLGATCRVPLCIHLPAVGRRRWCESRQCLQCQRAHGGCRAAGEPCRGAVPEILPQPASSTSRSSVGIWWPCCTEEGGQLRKHCGGTQGVPSGFGVECGRQGRGQWGQGGVLGLVAVRAAGAGTSSPLLAQAGCGAKFGALTQGRQRVFAHGSGSHGAPSLVLWGVSTCQEMFLGQVVPGGLLLSPCSCSRNVPQFPLLWSRLTPPLPTATWLPGGCRGLCRSAGCCTGDTVERWARGQGPGDA